MILDKWREAAQKFTEKLSEFNRQLVFAGIAVIWIFKIQETVRYSIPEGLLLALLFFVLSLGLDLMHYLYGSTAWTLFHRRKEDQIKLDKITEKTDLEAPKWMSNITYGFLYLKVLSNILAYILLLIYLYNELIK